MNVLTQYSNDGSDDHDSNSNTSIDVINRTVTCDDDDRVKNDMEIDCK